MQRTSFSQFVTYACIFLLFYWPTYFIPSITPSVMQKFYFIVMFAVLAIGILVTRTRPLVPAISYVYLLPLLAMLITFPSNWEKFSEFHFAVLIKPLLLFFYTFSFFSLLQAHFKITDLKKISNVLFVMLLLQLLLIALQIILGDVAFLKVISFKRVYSGYGFRASGSFDWVYITCYVLTFYLAYYILEFLIGEQKKTSVILIVLIFLAIFLSQSKTGYLATALIAIYFTLISVILNLGIAKKLLTLKLFFISIAVLAFIKLDLNLEYISRFLELISNGEMDGSTSTRKNQIIVAVEEGLTYWYSGSPNALKGLIIENTFLDYLFRYGLFGLIAITLLFLTFYFYSLRICFASRRNVETLGFKHLQLSIACHIAIASSILYGFTGTPMDAYRSAIWSAFVVALMAYLEYLNRSKLASVLPSKTKGETCTA
ncbi:hypothetical protein [Pseudoalteromonas sp. MMG022]|uniref:O-antigen ligase family protein n=1 Tax=Pseudoalteromonas sp. MMG022 TaxID=2909978 RepID=UPI001F281D08|nr:hypothetical protein [Pseudoalteromonas sp. MMG022]MCF6434954.1 hypothetical protein [Pseudoalteromonas sp. MMG022]